jgi:hypothetical protein
MSDKIKTIAHIEADVEAACKIHGVRGHLEHSHIENMIAQYTEEEKHARIEGKFQHLVGLRFKRFSRSIHVIRPFQVNLADYTVYHALDPHPRTNDAGLWLAVNRQGQKFVCDELWLKCQNGTEELATRVKEKNSLYRMERNIIDPSAMIEDQHTNKSLASRLREYGVHYVEATKARSQSDKRIEDALSYQELPGQSEMLRAPEVYIFDTCTQLIWEMEHYRWAEWKGRSAEEHSKKQTTLDKDDHMIECLGRLLFQEPQFHEMPTYSQGFTPEYNPDPYA